MNSQNGNLKSHEERKYIGMTLDPVHIGTGGYRLGRVDNTIARDPTTNLPILFGSSLEGTARTYSAYKLIEERKDNKYLNCAGKSDEETGKRVQCGACEICLTYGFSTKEKSLHGMAQFSDAQILFFPVHTMYGPVWVTCPRILNEFGLQESVSKDKLKTNLINNGRKLNLGWIYLENEGRINSNTTKFPDIPQEILNRIVIVADNLFSQVVNSNLEVRTSVSIDPKTGAAEEGALFTYEAIPRATVMYFTVTYLNPENFDSKLMEFKDEKGNGKKAKMEDMINIVNDGLTLFEFLGIGGMNTRGFGRFKILNGD
jgi:CRISPR-associated protein Cmr4